MTRHEKLVRDRIPELIADNGEHAEYRFITGDEHVQALLAKLAEESSEFAKERSVEELADVLEVVRSLAILTGHDFDDVLDAAAEKRSTHGSLLKGVYLIQTS